MADTTRGNGGDPPTWQPTFFCKNKTNEKLYKWSILLNKVFKVWKPYSGPDPTEHSLQRSHRPLAGGERGSMPPRKNSTPLSAYQAYSYSFGPLDFTVLLLLLLLYGW